MRLQAIYIFTLISLTLYGQQEPSFAFSQFNLSLVNPAYVGTQGKSIFTMTTRSQWSSIEGSPESFAFAYNTERNNNVGIGLSVISDKTFVEQQTFAFIDFSYKLQLSENARLFLGLKGGGNFYNADLSALETYNNLSDPSKVAMSRLKPNLGVGAYLVMKNNWISFAAPRLFEVQRADQEDILAKDRIHLYAAGGTSISLNNDFIIAPSIALRKIKGLPLITEATALITYRNQFSAGIQFRDNSSAGILSLFSITDTIGIGYAYESYLDTSLSSMNLTTHEFFIRLQLGKVDEVTEIPSEPTKEELPPNKVEN